MLALAVPGLVGHGMTIDLPPAWSCQAVQTCPLLR
jgi:hypothetical protein